MDMEIPMSTLFNYDMSISLDAKPGNEHGFSYGKTYKIGLQVCEDLWSGYNPHSELYSNGADIVFNLMPDLFTIGELKQVYELLLGKNLVNSAFRRTIAEKIVETNELVKTGGHRPSILCHYKGE